MPIDCGLSDFRSLASFGSAAWLLRVGVIAFSLSPLMASDYYVSPEGNDTNSGASAATPWKTIDRVNRNQYLPGDRILFQGGATFSGTLNFTSQSMGTAASPITVTSYGSSPAIIDGETGNGLMAYNTAGYLISGINFLGAGVGSNAGSGILFYADTPGNIKFDTIRIDHVNISGFNAAGLTIGSWNALTGYQNVSVTYTSVYNNGSAGIAIFGYSAPGLVGYPHENIYIGHVQAYGNQGIPGTTTSSGSGIVVGNTDGLTIERSVSYDNGAMNTANGGPVGIWCYETNNALIQYNESHHNHTNSASDGGGFDLDGGVINSILQYNYSHDNDGPGLLVVQYSGARPLLNNVIRYNISQNDARKNGTGGICLWNGGTGISKIEIYNNTIFISSASAMPQALDVMSATSNVHFRNNIFLTTIGVPLMRVAPGQRGMLLQGNDYWTPGGGILSFIWNGSMFAGLSSFRTGTGQEMLNGAAVGMSVDPKLLAPGTGGTIGNPDLLDTLNAYNQQPGSPMTNTALSLPALFGMNPGPTDFMGTILFQDSGYDIGAVESN